MAETVAEWAAVRVDRTTAGSGGRAARDRRPDACRHIDSRRRARACWAHLPRERKTVASASIPVVLWLAWWVIDPLIRESPRSRAIQTLQAAIRDEEKYLESISVPSTSSQAIEWMHRVGPVVKQQIERGARAEVRLVFQKGHEAETLVEVLPTAPSDPAPPPETKPSRQYSVKTSPPSLDLNKPTKVSLFWKRESGGDWLLVGNTL